MSDTTKINDAIQGFMNVCAQHDLSGVEILATMSMMVAQQLAMRPQIFTARWMNMMKEKKKEIQQHIKQEKQNVH